MKTPENRINLEEISKEYNDNLQKRMGINSPLEEEDRFNSSRIKVPGFFEYLIPIWGDMKLNNYCNTGSKERQEEKRKNFRGTAFCKYFILGSIGLLTYQIFK